MTASVPDSDSLRRAALQASWQRGRWVARRRLWWRWAIYALLRFVLPATALLGLIAGLVHAWSLGTRPPSNAATAPRTVPPAVEPEPALTGNTNANSASLRLDWAVSARKRPKADPTPAASSPAPTTTTNIGEPRP